MSSPHPAVYSCCQNPMLLCRVEKKRSHELGFSQRAHLVAYVVISFHWKAALETCKWEREIKTVLALIIYSPVYLYIYQWQKIFVKMKKKIIKVGYKISLRERIWILVSPQRGNKQCTTAKQDCWGTETATAWAHRGRQGNLIPVTAC